MRKVAAALLLILFCSLNLHAENETPDADDLEIEDMEVTGLGDDLETAVMISSYDTSKERGIDNDWWLRALIDKKTFLTSYQVYFRARTPGIPHKYVIVRYKNGKIVNEVPISYLGSSVKQFYSTFLTYDDYGMTVHRDTLEQWKSSPPNTIRLFSDTVDSRIDYELESEGIKFIHPRALRAIIRLNLPTPNMSTPTKHH